MRNALFQILLGIGAGLFGLVIFILIQADYVALDFMFRTVAESARLWHKDLRNSYGGDLFFLAILIGINAAIFIGLAIWVEGKGTDQKVGTEL